MSRKVQQGAQQHKSHVRRQLFVLGEGETGLECLCTMQNMVPMARGIAHFTFNSHESDQLPD